MRSIITVKRDAVVGLLLLSACDGRIAGPREAHPHDDAAPTIRIRTNDRPVDTATHGVDPGSTPPRIAWPPPSANPIDVAVWPRFLGAKLSPLPAGEGELCQRMSLDFVGTRTSTAEYRTRCANKTPAEMARAFMATPEYRARELRLWIEHLGEDPHRIAPEYIVEMDPVIDALATGRLAYDDFVAQILAHPTLALWVDPFVDAYDDGSDHKWTTATHAIEVFLGREPVGGEAVDFGNLFRVWQRRTYPRSASPSFFRHEFVWNDWLGAAELDGSACRDPIFGADLCTSFLFGRPTTVSIAAEVDGTPYEAFMGALPAAIEDELEKPGRLLASRTDFWEEAADRALRRFLGWWRSTSAQPDTDLPEVRRALGAWFRATPDHDLTKLYTAIVTSVLYASTASVAGAVMPDPPIWATGPTKEMDAHQWVEGFGHAFGLVFWPCDPHTLESPTYPQYYPNSFRAPQPPSTFRNVPLFYRYDVTSLGGCNGAFPESQTITLAKAFTHALIADDICNDFDHVNVIPASVDPNDTSTANVRTLAESLFVRLLSRPPSDEEATAIVDLAHCLGSSCTISDLARQMCAAIMRSDAYMFY